MKPAFAVVGLSHHTAPIEVRERMAFAPEQVEALLVQLIQRDEIDEALVLSTCNRVEIVVCAAPEVTLEQLDGAVVAQIGEAERALAPYLYRHRGGRGLEHLFRVASSLDSLVVGEPQILGQLKQALEFAAEVGTIGSTLRRVTTHAVRAAKRVRTETALGVGQVSVPSVAVDLTRRIFGNLSGRKAALLGLGEMGQLVAKQLGAEGANLLALGRNPVRVQEMAQSLGATPRGMDELEQTLVEADVVVTMTSAHRHVVERQLVARTARQRRGRSLFFVDLSVPRNVDPSIDELDDVFLYNIDDLSQIVQQSKSSRQGEAERAEAIVLEETQNFARATSAEQVTPTVVGLRRRLRATLRTEHEKSQRGKLRHLSAQDHQAVEKMIDAAVNKLLHAPTMKLRQLASNPGEAVQLDQLVGALTDLFELTEEDRVEPVDRKAKAKAAGDGRESVPPQPTQVGTVSGGKATTTARGERTPSERAGEPG